ncbi:MAG: MBL fold metallo-hydrolase [Gemmatimonadetes bacterium]|nr:MBL fold metallo-hydrolase [Gemmatimonadota bacterium]MYH54408.1 MBL fold metallo-hydrolase [Gemmatimonadota bacterium]MYK65937.1 MBL fold metallo-hydrolase [Gemmatimonadota bacterium]
MEILTFTGGPFVQNTLVVACADGRTALLIDPGAATPEALGAIRDRRLEVAAILLTHAHLDHIEGVAQARRETGAPIYLHPLDQPLYDSVAAQAAAFGVPWEEQPPPDLDLVPGENLSFGGSEFEVVFTPGHAPGHVMFVSTSEPVAIVGDVVFAGSIGRTDLPYGDYRVLMESIRNEVLTLPDETVLYTGHGPETTAGHERVTNPFLIPVYGGELV